MVRKLRLRAILITAAVVPATLIFAGLTSANAATTPKHVSHAVPVSQVKALPVPYAKGRKTASLQSTSPIRAAGAVGAMSVKPATIVAKAKPKAGFQKATSKVESMSTYKTIYKNADGTKTDTVSLFPLNEKTSGKWHRIVTKLSKDNKTGQYITSGQPLQATFAKRSGSKADFTVKAGKHTVSFHLNGERAATVARPTQAEVAASGEPDATTSKGVAYNAVMPDTNLSYQVDSAGVKEALILDSAPTDANPSYAWTVDAPGLNLVNGPAGSILYQDSSGNTVLETPTPLMTDSSGIAGQQWGAVDTIPLTYTNNGDGTWTLTLTPDPAWLNDPSRVYPVTLDPSTIQPAAGQIVSYESSNGSDLMASEDYANIGNSRNGGPSVWRTVAYYKYESIEGKYVLSSGLGEVYDGAGTTNAENVQASEAAKWGFQCQTTTRASASFSAGTSGSASLDVTSIMRHMVADGVSGTPLCLTGDETLTAYTYKQISTAVSITYETLPSVAATRVVESDPYGFHSILSSPTNETDTRTPTLTVSGSQDSGNGGSALGYQYSISTSSDMSSPIWTTPSASTYTSSTSVKVPSTLLQAGTKYYWQVTVEDKWGATNTSPVYSWTTSTDPTVPVNAAPTPPDNSTVSTLTPTLTAAAETSTDGNALAYVIRVTTGQDGQSGLVAVSGQLTPANGIVSWPVPAGLLNDGSSYTWDLLVNDYDDDVMQSVNRLTVNLRVTNPGPAPTDTDGPVTVNLANGNLSASFSSPTVSTVGGSMGMSFNYDSELQGNAGLTGSYYNVTPASGSPSFDFSSSSLPAPSIVRTDSDIAFDWNDNSSPGPGLADTDFMAEWDGYMTPPPGTYEFGFMRDDGARLILGQGSEQQTVLDEWSDGTGNELDWGTSATQQLVVASNGLSATLGGKAIQFPIPIKTQFYQGIGYAHISLEVQQAGNSSTAQVVPPSWFTRTVNALPSGWAGSSALDGDANGYVSEQNHEGYITLVDATGATHTYKRTSFGGYTPPAGESGVLTTDKNGSVTFTDSDGTVYLFSASGNLTSVATPQDVGKPAAPVPTYNSSAQLTSLSDPLSSNGATPPSYGRQVQFFYLNATTATTTGNGPGACEPASGSTFHTDLNPGMLCEMVYPDGSATHLYYDANGQLAEVVNPGNEITNFGYEQQATGALQGQFLLDDIRSPLVNDWLASTGNVNASPATTDVQVAYDQSNAWTSGFVTGVTLPAPDGATASQQPQKTYTYASQPTGTTVGTTFVDEAGLTVPTTGNSDGHAETITYNQALQGVSTAIASGLTSQSVWNSHDDLMASISPQGEESSTAYDSQDRATDTYGPAPTSCYPTSTSSLGTSQANIVPTSGTCAALGTPTAHTSTSYDTGLHGLAASWYSNQYLSGVPAAYSLGTGDTGGEIDHDWGSASPIAGIPATDWTADFTGLITFPTAGTYEIYTYEDDGAEVFLNDQLVISDWGSHSAHYSPVHTVVATAGEVMRIRVEYLQETGDGHLELDWATPGKTVPTTDSSNVPIPGADLAPAYNLATSNHTDDSVPTGVSGVSNSQVQSTTGTTSYGSSPWLGQATSSVVDSGTGTLNLTSSSTFEKAGTGYLRQLTTVMPAGAGTTSTSTYYGDNESYGTALNTSTPICGVPVNTPQYGMAETTTGPTNSDGVARTTQYVYDVMGRMVGSKSPGDTAWTCTTYDSRGRVTAVAYPSFGSTPARTVTTSYTSDGTSSGDPLVTWTQDNGVPDSPTNGRVTTTADLDGRTVSATDVWGTVNTTTYNRISEATTTTSTTAAGTSSTLTMSYDIDGNLLSVSNGGTNPLETVGYTGGKISQVQVDLGSNSVTGNVGYDAAGTENSVDWHFPNGQNSVTDSEVRSQAGRILTETLTDGTTSYGSSYTYDGAGRLVAATVPDNSLTYSFGSSACGTNANAGEDGDRTAMTDSLNGGAATTTTYCYDNADRLTGTTVSGAPSNADELLSTNLTTSGSNANLGYDAHGNVTTLANEAMTYDEDDRHMSTTSSTGAAVSYERDAAGDIVEMTTTTTAGNVTTYRYSSDGGGEWTFDSAGRVVEQTEALSGAELSFQASGTSAAFENLQGAVAVTSDGTGARTGAVSLYDPFGNSIDPSTGQIGTTTADSSVPKDTATTGTERGWAAGAGKKTTTALPIESIEMGDRQYVPLLGRFLSVDPIAGGGDNDYSYANDPVNNSDYSGDMLVADEFPPQYITKEYITQAKELRKIYASTAYIHLTARYTPAAPRVSSGKMALETAAINRADSHKEATQRSLDEVANIANTVSTVTGFIGLIPIPGVQEVAIGVSLVSGGVGAALDCRHGFTSTCDLDLSALALGGVGKGMKIFRIGATLSDESKDAITGAGTVAGLMPATYGTATGWASYAYGK
ncbi:PA14 domain-containing protein [Frondihabitans australicus]|uniref:RHS repeat-associated protein n=1 Tax=Frondihabitans australicus TaxID=386892 RepID=A0A495IIR6_9MICO|nr:PA14 domain-containing protein [Frondihabitans australicus]RKR75877.1 RHS repeat-associated protein [Frondihabitans australicus]